MKSLGLQTYRLSIGWPRHPPERDWQGQPAGLDFYSRLVDGLLEAGIRPFVTLYHWDLPQTIEDRAAGRRASRPTPSQSTLRSWRGGGRPRQGLDHAERAVGERLAGLQHGRARARPNEHARRHPAAHHLLLGHGLAVPVIRRDSPDSQVGITLNLSVHYPASESEADEKAARLADAPGTAGSSTR